MDWVPHLRTLVRDIQLGDLQQIVEILGSLSLNPQKEDSRLWLASKDEVLSVASFFAVLSSKYCCNLEFPCRFVWRAFAPSKIWAFVWKATWVKLNTRERVQLKNPHIVFSLNLPSVSSSRRISLSSAHLLQRCRPYMGLFAFLAKVADDAGMVC